MSSVGSLVDGIELRNELPNLQKVTRNLPNFNANKSNDNNENNLVEHPRTTG